MPLDIHITHQTAQWRKGFGQKNIEISIQNACEIAYFDTINALKKTPDLSAFEENIVEKFIQKPLRVEISVVLANDVFVRDLNRRYRDQDKPTNVLSFGNGDIFTPPAATVPIQVLGDIVLAYERVALEAQQQDKSFENHLLHLVVHSTLHLLGLDHGNQKKAHSMERLECSILKTLNIPNPY